MSTTINPAKRVANLPAHLPTGPITLINSFAVPEGRDEAFLARWSETSAHFRAQPGFRSLRMHREASGEAPYRFVNIAEWTSAEHFAAAHDRMVFQRLISNPAWQEFPSSPALYSVLAEFRASGVEAPAEDSLAECATITAA